MPDSLDELRYRLREFAEERDWGKFHTAKNLAMAVAGEAGELVAELQWQSDDDILPQLHHPDSELSERLRDELADILIYLIRLADVCDIDLLSAAVRKIDANETRYPAHLARGRASKYDELRSHQP
jgi:NTP pyrophosphatase (non-canonical NTP hydrolase)